MNEAEWDHIECRQSFSYNWIHRNYYIEQKASVESEFNHVMMSAMFFMNLIQKKEEKQKKIEVFSVSMTDIEKS
jgi:hypothetical protein